MKTKSRLAGAFLVLAGFARNLVRRRRRAGASIAARDLVGVARAYIRRFAFALVMQRSRFDQLPFFARYDHFPTFEAANNQQPVRRVIVDVYGNPQTHIRTDFVGKIRGLCALLVRLSTSNLRSKQGWRILASR